MSLEVIHRSCYVLISHSINPETSKPQIVIENGVAYGGMRPVICVEYTYSRLMMYVCNVFRPFIPLPNAVSKIRRERSLSYPHTLVYLIFSMNKKCDQIIDFLSNLDFVWYLREMKIQAGGRRTMIDL